MRKIGSLFISVLLGLALAACGSPNSSALLILSGDSAGVDLGKKGNESVAGEFQKYIAKGPGCSATGSNPRVLLTGFGLFAGKANISGLIVDNMASEKFWSSQSNLDQQVPPHLKFGNSGKLTAADHGGKAVSRVLNIDGRDFDVCFLLLDVKWDLAAAIIVHEMEQFQPNLVVMTGRGDADVLLEGGATNATLEAGGFSSRGTYDESNMPRASSKVLPPADAGVQSEIATTWDARKLKSAIQTLVEKEGFNTLQPKSPRPENQYVCNNVTFVALHAAKGVTLRLAGGQIVLQPRISSKPEIGFMHIPATASVSEKSIFRWSRIMANLIFEAFQ